MFYKYQKSRNQKDLSVYDSLDDFQSVKRDNSTFYETNVSDDEEIEEQLPEP